MNAHQRRVLRRLVDRGVHHPPRVPRHRLRASRKPRVLKAIELPFKSGDPGEHPW